jgi:hypothetical protein
MRYLSALVLCLAVTAFAAAEAKKGTPEVKSITALAFGPDGVLFVGDPAAAKVYAVATDDTKPAGKEDVKVEKITDQAASMLGLPADKIQIADMKVNPASGNIYLAVRRGVNATAPAVVLKVTRDGKLHEFPLKDVTFSAVELANANDKQRTESITSLGFANGKLIIAGLSNEEFASTLRTVPYPFEGPVATAGIKIFHGAHGKFETQAPVRTFTTYKIGNAEHVIAAYTCTPLVKFPVSDLQPGAKVTGTTLAELGNRNRPLDMIVYKKGGKDYVLMANNARGVMKVSTEQFDIKDGIVERPKSETAGSTYEKIDAWKGVEQLDKLDDTRAVVLMKTEGGTHLTSVELP